MKNFCLTVDPIKKEEKQAKEQENTFAAPVPNKRLLPRIDKELLSIKREVETPSRNEQKPWTWAAQKKIYKWPVNIMQCAQAPY